MTNFLMNNNDNQAELEFIYASGVIQLFIENRKDTKFYKISLNNEQIQKTTKNMFCLNDFKDIIITGIKKSSNRVLLQFSEKGYIEVEVNINFQVFERKENWRINLKEFEPTVRELLQKEQRRFLNLEQQVKENQVCIDKLQGKLAAK